ncbi:MAG TPA: AMP-binding protein, partial [Pseudohongiella sp.]|nr:AMP-binding protein [Pseudohongiella sp.]
MPLPLDSAQTIIDCLEHYAGICADKDAYIFLPDGESQEVHLTYKRLHTRATALAEELQARNLSGKTVLLLYPAGLEFIVSFIACLYAGAIAVPANLARNSRHFVRLKNIMLDSNCAAVLTLPALTDTIENNLVLAGVDMRFIDIVSETDSGMRQSTNAFQVSSDGVAFIQYTSGSTGHPKGVVVTHANLIANERAIQQSSNLPEFMVGAGWLPQFHDMGLIGNLLQPLAVGGTYIFMSPLHFIQAPLRWIRMLSIYRAHASAAPCFALEMCVAAAKDGIDPDWDLSALGTIFCGAEPINQRILDRFQTCFAHIGMSADAVKPCYGMAETTLIIAGGLPVHAERSLKVDRDALQQGKVAL